MPVFRKQRRVESPDVRCAEDRRPVDPQRAPKLSSRPVTGWQPRRVNAVGRRPDGRGKIQRRPTDAGIGPGLTAPADTLAVIFGAATHDHIEPFQIGDAAKSGP